MREKAKRIVKIPIFIFFMVAIIVLVVFAYFYKDYNTQKRIKADVDSEKSATESQIGISKNANIKKVETAAFETKEEKENITLSGCGPTFFNNTSIYEFIVEGSLVPPNAQIKLKYTWSSNSEKPSNYKYEATATSFLEDKTNNKLEVKYEVKAENADLESKYLHVMYEMNGIDILGLTVGPLVYDNTNPTPGTITMRIGGSNGEIYDGNWTSNSIYISLTNGSDSLSGHKSTVYSIDGGTAQTGSTTISTSGNHTVKVKTTDNAGNTATRTYTAKIDTKKPTAGTITMLAGGTDGEVYDGSTWTNKEVYISPTNGSDNLSGHKSTVYSINGGTLKTASTVITASGENSIKLTTTDNAGNTSFRTYTAKVDRESPTISIDNPTNGEWTKNAVTLTASASDSNSGLQKMQYKIGSSGEWTDWGNESSASKTFSGTYYGKFYVRAIDNVGNQVEADTTLHIDPIAPTIESVTKSTEGWTNKSVVLTINGAKDTFMIGGKEYTSSGLADKPYSFDGGKTWTSSNTSEYSENKNGIVIKVRDKLGNIYTHETINITNIDKTVPTGTISASTTATNQNTVTIYLSVEDKYVSELKLIEIKGWYGTNWDSTHTEGNVKYDSANNRYYATFLFDNIKNTTTGETKQGDGKYTFNAHIYDNAGNHTITKRISVVYDTTLPTAGTMTMKLNNSSGTNYINNTYTDQNVYLEVNNGSDLGSGHKTTVYSVNGGQETSEAQILTESGIYNIVVTTTDNVGNKSTNSYTVKIRRVESILVTTNPDKLTYNAYEDFNTKGMIISIKYDNGQTEETLEYIVINGENLTCRVNKIEIQYNKDTQIKTQLSISVSHDIQTKTCTTDGKCKVEGCNYTEEAQGHNFASYVSNNDATCIEDGTKTAKCTRCGATNTIVDTGSKLGHNYEEKVTAPTCTEKGYTTHECARCEEKYVDTYTEKLGHSFTKYVSNNNATCTKDGTKTAKCDRCKSRDTTGDVGSKLGHNYEEKVTAPTCTEKGYTTHECTRCEEKYVDTYTEKLGHSFTKYVSNNDATCTKDGTKTAKCDRCESRDTTEDIGSKLGHNYEEKVTAPTCTEKGYTTHECTKCKDSYVDTYVNKLGHSFTNYVSNNDATCIKDGTKTARCDRCEARDTTGDIGSKLGHNYEEKITKPTCTEKGYSTYECVRCEETYVDTYTEALGHSFTNYVSNNDATCIEDGTETAKCDRCNELHTKQDKGSVLGHNYEDGKCAKCGEKEFKLEVQSEKYNINYSWITKIQVKTTIKSLKNNIETNATEINVYSKENEKMQEEQTLTTGMKIQFKLKNEIKTFTIIVSGDVNCDGEIKLSDMLMVNRHRLNKIKLEGVQFLAADVNEDGVVNFKDLVKISRFRLNRISEL